MNTIDRIKHNRLVKRIYEAPYRVNIYHKMKRSYRDSLASLSKEDIDRITSLKDIHEGKKCFIIGLGPSLTEDDLKLVSHEICFAVNSGYRVMKKLGLCPDYYVAMDDDDLTHEQILEVLDEDNDVRNVFVSAYMNMYRDRLVALPTDASPLARLDSFLNILSPKLFPYGRFSTDIARVLYPGKTVIVAAMQVAAYMGFSEIYLIGTDCDYTGPQVYTNLNDEDITALKGRDPKTVSDVTREQMGAVAEDARRQGVHIYNATRGGALECFIRRSLEEIDITR